jgi:hypothetical protein
MKTFTLKEIANSHGMRGEFFSLASRLKKLGGIKFDTRLAPADWITQLSRTGGFATAKTLMARIEVRQKTL